jgi:serine/threonine protein kinase
MVIESKKPIAPVDFSHAQKSGTICSQLLEQRALPGCVAPEVLMESSHITSAADVWALGCILFQLMTGELPFRADRLTGPALLAGIGEVISDPQLTLGYCGKSVASATSRWVRGRKENW